MRPRPRLVVDNTRPAPLLAPPPAPPPLWVEDREAIVDRALDYLRDLRMPEAEKERRVREALDNPEED